MGMDQQTRDEYAAMPPEERDATFQFCCGAADAYERVQLLIELGADLNAHTESGQSALAEAAISEGTDRILELLLEKGARVNVADCHGYTPLLLAAQRGAAARCVAMLKHGADPNIATDDGETPLLTAVHACDGKPGYVDVVRVLLDAGADPNRAAIEGPRSGQTPLSLAVRLGRERAEPAIALIRLLRSYGARPDDEVVHELRKAPPEVAAALTADIGPVRAVQVPSPRREAERLAPKALVHLKGPDGKVLCGGRASAASWTLAEGTCPDCIKVWPAKFPPR